MPQIKRTIALLAPRLRQDAATIASNLEDLATLLSPIGLDSRKTQARLPHAVAMLKTLRQDVAELPTDNDEHIADLVNRVTRTADATLSYVTATMMDARATADHLIKLLIDWRSDPTTVGRQFARTDWLMDGWDRICQLWMLAASTTERLDAIEEIAGLLPIIPNEAGEWVGFHIEFDQTPSLKRLVSRHEDWRTGLCVQDTIARNEALLAS